MAHGGEEKVIYVAQGGEESTCCIPAIPADRWRHLSRKPRSRKPRMFWSVPISHEAHDGSPCTLGPPFIRMWYDEVIFNHDGSNAH